MIDADRRTLHVYRPGREPEEVVAIDRIADEGPLAVSIISRQRNAGLDRRVPARHVD